jgi:hypothetical protein
MKHLFKSSYALVALCAIAIDLAQIVKFLVHQLSAEDAWLDQDFAALATAAQYALFVVNVAAMRYFFRGVHIGLYLRKTVRHEYTYLFAIIFVLRFCDLILHKQNHAAGYAINAFYLAGVFLKHMSRLALIQLLCAYRFQSAQKMDLLPAWKLVLYASPNVIDSAANIVRLSIGFVYVITVDSAKSTPLTKGAALLFVADLLYYYYNWLLVSAFVLKLMNPRKDVLRYVHKESTVDMLVVMTNANTNAPASGESESRLVGTEMESARD